MHFTPAESSNLLFISKEKRSFETGSARKFFIASSSPGSIPPLNKKGLSMFNPFNLFQLNFLPVPP
jgi:hypothetical protein